jgi:L-asparagine transporter-like permease
MKANKWFVQIILKLGIFILTYIALILSQVMYPEIYEPQQQDKPKAKPSKLTTWFGPMKVWLVQQASKAGATIKKWRITCKSQRRMRKTQAIAIRMQSPLKPTHCMIALMAFTVVAMEASSSGSHNNMAMFDTAYRSGQWMQRLHFSPNRGL